MPPASRETWRLAGGGSDRGVLVAENEVSLSGTDGPASADIHELEAGGADASRSVSVVSVGRLPGELARHPIMASRGRRRTEYRILGR